MLLSIHHETQYDYSAPLDYALQTLCLTPQDSAHQRVRRWSVEGPGRLYPQRDAYGNLSHTWTTDRPLWRGRVLARGEVETLGVPELADAPGGMPPPFYLRSTPLTEPDDAIGRLGRRLWNTRPDVSALLSLAGEVAQAVAYRRARTHVGTTAAEALTQGAGVCQDQAHVYIAACRSAGVPARYVSGYFHAGSAPDAPRLASHAWVDVCIDTPAALWLGVDVTHHCLIDERHVRVAIGPDYAACPPTRGVRIGGGDELMDVRIRIEAADAAHALR